MQIKFKLHWAINLLRLLTYLWRNSLSCLLSWCCSCATSLQHNQQSWHGWSKNGMTVGNRLRLLSSNHDIRVGFISLRVPNRKLALKLNKTSCTAFIGFEHCQLLIPSAIRNIARSDGFSSLNHCCRNLMFFWYLVLKYLHKFHLHQLPISKDNI